jgi:hypothetical protein
MVIDLNKLIIKELMNTITFANKYGQVELKPVTAYMPVNQINSKMLPSGCTFSIDTAEQIALITDNKHLQMSFIPGNMRVCYIMHHDSASVAAVCEVSSLIFVGTNATEEIARLAKSSVLTELQIEVIRNVC